LPLPRHHPLLQGRSRARLTTRPLPRRGTQPTLNTRSADLLSSLLCGVEARRAISSLPWVKRSRRRRQAEPTDLRSFVQEPWKGVTPIGGRQTASPTHSSALSACSAVNPSSSAGRHPPELHRQRLDLDLLVIAPPCLRPRVDLDPPRHQPRPLPRR